MTVSIGLPVYNVRPYIIDCLRSIFSQSMQDWELIVVDDCSTDGTYDLVRSIRDERVSVYRNESNRGIAHSLNRISTLARGDYLMRMDGDDMMSPFRVERQYAEIVAHTGVGMLGTSAFSITAEGRLVGIRRVPNGVVTSNRDVLGRGPLMHASAIGPTAWFVRHPYREDRSRAEDRELWARTAATTTFSNIDDPLYFVREVGTVTLAKYLNTMRLMRLIYREHAGPMVGHVGSWRLQAETYVKSATCWLAFASGHPEMLVRRRTQAASLPEAAVFERDMAIIAATHVPGVGV